MTKITIRLTNKVLKKKNGRGGSAGNCIITLAAKEKYGNEITTCAHHVQIGKDFYFNKTDLYDCVTEFDRITSGYNPLDLKLYDHKQFYEKWINKEITLERQDS